jgi:catechol 2,3-dioxygenase-like lactoylglutathione lyase family enzyme
MLTALEPQRPLRQRPFRSRRRRTSTPAGGVESERAGLDPRPEGHESLLRPHANMDEFAGMPCPSRSAQQSRGCIASTRDRAQERTGQSGIDQKPDISDDIDTHGAEDLRLTVERIDHLVLNVKDVETSAAWYGRVLGMRREISGGRMILWFGEQKMHLRPVTTDQNEWFTGEYPAAGSNDLCFTTKMSVPEITAHLKSCGVTIELGPAKRAGARGTMTSVYCRDPDGSLIEIATYGT